VELQPPDSGKAVIFRTKSKFFGQNPAAKNEEIHFLCLLNENTEFILFSEIKGPKSGIFTNNYWVGWVGKRNFASQHSSFFRALSKIFFGKDGSAPPAPPRKKIIPYAYAL